MLAAGAIGGLFDGVDGQHTERCRDTGCGVHRRDALGGLAGDVLEVRGIAADHGAEADHRVNPAVRRELARGDRNLEGAGDPHHVDVTVADPSLSQ